MVKQLSPTESYQRLQTNKTAVLIDVRSQGENQFVGHPINAIWIPWVDEPDWQPYPEGFMNQVVDKLGEGAQNTEIFLLCRSGQRSNSAGECLASYGFTNVNNVVGGFEGELDDGLHRSNKSGWRHDGLPWMQS